jgi:hypothetical protein
MASEGKAKTPKKFLGLSPLTWGAIVGGAGAIYLYVAKKKSSATAASTGTSDGQTTPYAVETTGASGPSTLPEWISAALGSITNGGYSPTQALNDINSWLGGSCVSAAGYTALGGIVETLGLPPGYSTVPTLSVCQSAAGTTTTGTSTTTSTTTPNAPVNPGLNPSLKALLTTNNETIVDTAYDAATSTWLYLTNIGGIYTETPSGATGGVFYNSYPGLPAGDRQGGKRTFNKITANPNGSYTITDTAGETYTFDQSTVSK